MQETQTLGAKVRIRLASMRLGTLTISVAPVIVGAALAWRTQGVVDTTLFVITLAAAVLIQIATNLYNDVADHEADVSGLRLAPKGAVARGDISAREAAMMAHGASLLALLLGLWLVKVGGWPILLIGISSLIAGAAYSLGPRPISHTPFGELFVILFFGIAGVVGTYYLQTGTADARAVIGGLIVGLPAAAVLLVNNTRDEMQDRAAGRRTLSIVLGRSRSFWVYAALLLLPYALLFVPPGFVNGSGRLPWLPLLTLPVALWLVLQFRRRPLEMFTDLLVRTAKLQFAISALLALALVQ